MKKNVRKNEYSIVIKIAFQTGLLFQVIWAEMSVESTTISIRRQFSPYLFDFSLFVHFRISEIMNPGMGEMNSEM